MPIYQVKVGGNEYTVEIANPNQRPVQAVIGDRTIEVQVESPISKTVDTSTLAAPAPAAAPVASVKKAPVAAAGSGDVTAPLPGVLVTISVKEGDTVAVGDELCVLEAMKMKNPIRATRAGKVTAIHVAVGQQVQHGAPLLTLES